MNLPVLNFVEQVFVMRPSQRERVLEATDVCAPCQFLPAPNTATIRDGWMSWSALTAAGPGRHMRGKDEQLQACLNDIDWKSVMMVRDNLLLNDCVIALEERRLEASGNDQATIVGIECASHSAVLCQKPFLSSLAGVPSSLVTMGHCLESGRTHGLYVEAIKK